MEFDDPSVADLVVENGVCDECADSLFVGVEEDFPAFCGEVHGFSRANKVAVLEHAVVDASKDGGFGDEGAEFLHDVEGERGSSETGLVVEAEVGIEAHGSGRESAVLGQEAVGEGEQSVDRIGGWSAVAAIEVESKCRWRRSVAKVDVIFGFDHAIEFGEVSCSSRSLGAQEFGQGLGIFGGFREALEFDNGG